MSGHGVNLGLRGTALMGTFTGPSVKLATELAAEMPSMLQPGHLPLYAGGRIGGIDSLGQGTETGPRHVDTLHRHQQVRQRSRQAIELPDDDHIAGPQLIDHAVSLGAIPSAAGGGLREDPLDPGGLEGPALTRAVSPSPANDRRSSESRDRRKHRVRIVRHGDGVEVLPMDRPCGFRLLQQPPIAVVPPA